MSIRSRIENAKVLYESKCVEGCLLMLLVAIAATSRKRNPKGAMSDGEAFKRYLHDEMKILSGGVQNFNLQFRGEMRPLEDVLYHFVRCELAHEGTLPRDFILEDSPGFSVNVTETAVTFSKGLLDGLFRVVVQTPENKDEFANLLASAPVNNTDEESTEPCQT